MVPLPLLVGQAVHRFHTWDPQQSSKKRELQLIVKLRKLYLRLTRLLYRKNKMVLHQVPSQKYVYSKLAHTLNPSKLTFN